MIDARQKMLHCILDELSTITDRSKKEFSEDTPLIGANAFIKSRQLVELVLALEDFMEDSYQIEFDWQSDSTLSEAQSIYRSIGTLADHLATLVVQKKD